MELFMTNVPPDLTDRALHVQLAEYTTGLGIDDWSCQKPRKKNFGRITFLHPYDGERFLQQYNLQRRLMILGNPVACKPSTHPLDPYLLKSLEKAAEDRQQSEKHPPAPTSPNVIFNIRGLSCGYYDYADGNLFYSPEVEWATPNGYAKFAKRALILTFDAPYGYYGKQRIEIPYRIVEALVVSTTSQTLTLTLWEAPRFFHVDDSSGMVGLMLHMSLANQKQQQAPSRRRLVELAGESPGSRASHRAVLGHSLVYNITAVMSPADFHAMVKRLRDRDVLTIYQSHQDMPVPAGYLRQNLADALGPQGTFTTELQRCTRDGLIPFAVLYQMEALVRNGFLLPWTVQDLLRMMTALTSRGFPISAAAVKKLFSQIPFPSREVDASTFSPEEIWKYILENEAQIRLGNAEDLITAKGRQNLTMVHKVSITPTGMSMHGPDPEAKNRILRRFPQHTEYFIRVQFCDEDGVDLQFNSNVSNEDIFTRFKGIFKNGIPIAGRVYGFLGFSHSSLRSHSAWFMAPFVYEGKIQSYFTVISHLGKFDNIHSPARCAARIGQAFSETPMAISLVDNAIKHKVIADVSSADGSRVFSDGVGTISWSVMEAIHEIMPNRKLLDGPTCFQIRHGGSKGMLALDPQLGDDSIMCLRPSMIKFLSEDTENLEICDTANKPSAMVLNRQTIKILEDMGVSADWFLKHQASVLQSLQMLTAHVANTAHFLKHQNIASAIGFSSFIRQLHRIGIDYRKDRFLSSIIETAILRELRLLKHKARIPIKQGATLFGIMDETGYLREGEIFITFNEAPFIQDENNNPTSYMDLDHMEMIVTRSPALHPGDIQLANNIIPPVGHPLRELRNCIVFSQKGHRDLPSCLSGGDLDGDVYQIIWDKEAVQQCRNIYAPADYPRVEPLNIGRTVQREDMSDFFIQFMATDQLGLIAVKHMILADQKPAGTLDQNCLLLAEMHSTGVDYSKTGIPVDMTRLRGMRPSKYRPDFLSPAPPANIKDRTEIHFDAPVRPSTHEEDDDDVAGPTHEYYKSEKINGLLYRAIDEQKIWFNDIKIPVNHGSNIWDDLLKYIKRKCDTDFGRLSWDKEKKEAWGIRRAYEDAIWNATYEFSDHASKRLTELEVFTGSIYNKTGNQTRRQRDKSVKLKDEFDRIAHWAVNMIRKRNSTRGIGEAEDQTGGTQAGASGPSESLILSIACLHVGVLKDATRRGQGRDREEFQSFKVVAAACVIKELNAAFPPKYYV